MAAKVQYQIRIDERKLEQFQRIMPWHGSFSQFVQQALDEFLRQWGDRPTPSEVTTNAVRAVHDGKY